MSATVTFAVVAAVVLIGPPLAAAWIIVERCIGDADSYDRAISDVATFIELTERSREELRSAPRLPLLDTEDAYAATDAISRAIVLTAAARCALWPALTRAAAPHAGAAKPRPARVESQRADRGRGTGGLEPAFAGPRPSSNGHGS